MDIKKLHDLFLKCDSICTDTRSNCKGSLFFALKGVNFNGNDFALESLSKGANCAIVDDKTIDHPKCLLVDDVLKTLQELSNFHRKKLKKTKIIALTGSNGKTTTKELINCVLNTTYKTSSTIGNLNNHIGVPLSLLNIEDDTEFAVIEMGANHQGEISLLTKLVEPDFGLITNFGKAHLEGFGGVDGFIKGKKELYTWLLKNHKPIIINYDDPIQRKYVDKRSITYGKNESANFMFSQKENELVEFEYQYESIKSNLIGDYNFYNLICATTIGLYFNVSVKKIRSAIKNYKSKNNRSEIRFVNKTKIILDAYNANPTSIYAAIESFIKLPGSKVIILGEMMELGKFSKTEHQKIINNLEKLKIKSFFVGNEFFNLKKQSPNLFFFKTKEDLLEEFPIEKIKSKNILIKGSRFLEMEKILEQT